jgi:hypothetical protein
MACLQLIFANMFLRIFLTLSFCVAFIPTRVFSWGFYGHRLINRAAIFTLPPELFAFYRYHLLFLEEEATAADRRRGSDPLEAPRHFIDLERYGPPPYVLLPSTWKEAVACYHEEELQKHGILPWHIQLVYYRLIEAFRLGDVDRILRLSADLGHYLADAHVPLHVTHNYNGQFTGQHGLHSLLESRIPELMGSEYDLLTGKAIVVERVRDMIWDCIRESAGHLPLVFEADCRVRDSIAEDDWKVPELRGQTRVMAYSISYAMLYNEFLGNIMEERMRLAIHRLGSLWFTAWVEAGHPALKTDIKPPEKGSSAIDIKTFDRYSSQIHRCAEGN